MISANFTYDSFDEETKKYINRAIDMYLLIKNKDLSYYHKDIIRSGDRDLSLQDKKAYSFLLAVDYLDDKTKKPFDEEVGFNMDEYCKFIGLDKSSIKKIKPLKEEEYRDFFEDDFSLFLKVYLDEYSRFGKEVKVIKPEVIMSAMCTAHHAGSDIVENYFEQHNRDFQSTCYDNPLYKMLEAICEKNGFVVWEDQKQKKDDDDWSLPPLPPLISGNHSNIEFNNMIQFLSKEGNIEEPKPKMKIDVTESPIWDYIDVLKKKFIGQEEFAEEMFYNLVNNFQLSQMKGVNAGRSIIFVDGPSGTGKTAITTDIAEKLCVPCVCSSITHYTASGYVGGDLKDLLEQLYEKSNRDLNLAQRGIIILDEFDKVAINGDRDLSMKQAVQDQLLSLLGGEKYSFTVGRSLFGGNDIEFDTSKLTIVCLGAITNLREEKTSNKQTIGFTTEEKEEDTSYVIKPEDLIKMGLQKELVGRINTFLHTKDYSVEDLEKILKESSISPMVGFKEWAEALGKKVVIDDEVYPLVAEKAYDLNTGARSLQTVMNSIRTRFLKTVLRGEEKELSLTPDDVNAAYAKTINRAKRG